jgi:SAM-dependent methyltransferase
MFLLHTSKGSQPRRTIEQDPQPIHGKTHRGNPFDDPIVVSRYEDWYAGVGSRADRLEKKLLSRLLAGFQDARSALEVGCGTGHFIRWLAERGLKVAGLDVSPAMLAEARRQRSPPCVLGDALALPFDARAFDLVLLITVLEFINDPLRALHEAVRVARCGVLVGALNRCSLVGFGGCASRSPVRRSARLFSPGDLTRLARQAAGTRIRKILWRTTIWPLPGIGALPLPWGAFIGLALYLKSEHPGVRK